MLNVSFTQNISDVAVYNLLGQQVLFMNMNANKRSNRYVYNALVNELGQGWQQLLDQITAEVRHSAS